MKYGGIEMKYKWEMETPIGKIVIAESDGAISHLLFYDDKRLAGYETKETPGIKKAEKQLKDYFEGKRTEFDLPLYMDGTDFQKSVWGALQKIPYGETRSYKEIAEQIGNPKAVRAVGLTNGKNPISIIVPCHRVIGSNGKLTGYAGGLGIKDYLLKLEEPKK